MQNTLRAREGVRVPTRTSWLCPRAGSRGRETPAAMSTPTPGAWFLHLLAKTESGCPAERPTPGPTSGRCEMSPERTPCGGTGREEAPPVVISLSSVVHPLPIVQPAVTVVEEGRGRGLLEGLLPHGQDKHN